MCVCACACLYVRVARGDWNQKIIFCALWGHREPPCSGATWCRLLSWAQRFLGETRMEVEHLAVIQRKCAKCYQNWISRQQLCSMNRRGREQCSFQVTHGWNFSTPLHFFLFHVWIDVHISSLCLGGKSILKKSMLSYLIMEKQQAHIDIFLTYCLQTSDLFICVGHFRYYAP